MKLRVKILLINFFIALSLSASTATDAEKYYRAEDWSKAEALYAQLLKQSSSNRIYNHRYGVCLYEQGKDLAKAEKHLVRSKNAGITLSAYYLGGVCFLQYKFDDAMSYYKYYLSKATDKENRQAATASLLKCEQGKAMIERVEDVKILDRVEVDKSDFFFKYAISKESGSFLTNAADINEDSIAENSTIYLTERGDRAFFSVLEEQGHTNLYSKNRLLDQWAAKTSLGNNVNTEFDEDYPFLMSDGIVLYFSSKGHNSFGGYDIYVTRFNTSLNSYMPPQQLGMPFNSFADDILLAIDEYNNIGWFASDRDSEEGRIAIYTFEPNSTFQLLDTDNEQERINAAMINYTLHSDTVDNVVVAPSETIARKPKAEQHKIYFVINDTLIYSDLDDFMSDEAQDLFLQYERASSVFDSTSTAVAQKRVLYSRASNSDAKATLIAEIMELESNLFEAEGERDKLLLATRRMEVETIHANGGYIKPKPEVVEAPVVREEIEEKHVSPWGTPLVTVTQEEVTRPFFYNKNLYTYYEQIFSTSAIDKLVEANKKKTMAGNKQFLADYVMRQYNAPTPEESFFEKVFSYDSTLTPELSQSEIIDKVKKISDEGAILFVEANYLSFYTLKGQNVMLMETVQDQQCRQEMTAMMDRAAFSFQQADQMIYVSDGVYTRDKEDLAQGNNLLKDGIQFLEATTLTYLKYRYEAQQAIVAQKPAVEKAMEELAEKLVEETAQEEITEEPLEAPSVAAVDSVVRTEVPAKTLNTQVTSLPAEEYRIQFGIFSRILQDGEIPLSDISYYQYSESKLYKYYTGTYSTPLEAAMALEEVKAKGYKDAFVVAFVDGKPK